MKNLNFLFFTIFFVLLTAGVKAQTIDEIKNNPAEYIWGEGHGSSTRKADEMALADLVSQISTTVQSSFSSILSQDNGDYNEQVQSVVYTYSEATLTNTERRILSNDPGNVSVFRFIKRSEIGKIFENRKNKILEYVVQAEEALSRNQIADALRFYYWSYVLLRTHPDASQISYLDAELKDRLLSVWLPSKINMIFGGITTTIEHVEESLSGKLVNLSIKYNGNPVRNFDYSYWTGNDWSNIVSAKDGRGFVELSDLIEANSVDLLAEYEFRNEAKMDKELDDVMEKLEQPPVFPRSKFKAIKASALPKAVAQEEQIQYEQILSMLESIQQMKQEEQSSRSVPSVTTNVATAQSTRSVAIMETTDSVRAVTKELAIDLPSSLVTFNDSLGYLQMMARIMGQPEVTADSAALAKAKAAGAAFKPVKNPAPYLAVMGRLETAIRQGIYDGLEDCFTPEGYEMYNQLIRYGYAKIVGIPSYQFVEFEGNIVCRSLPLCFSFQNNKRSFVEDVVFDFSKEGLINSISFALAQEALNDITSKQMWSESARMTIIRFLENYKTAYALKRLDYIESIFSEDAVIIVGSRLQRQPQTDKLFADEQQYRYVRQTKEQYIKHMRTIFASNEFINLRFVDNNIRKGNLKQGELYGIQIRQEYSSSSYGDVGYLFLMVDLNNPKKPIIHVRTWQPEKDPEFGVFNASMFNF